MLFNSVNIYKLLLELMPQEMPLTQLFLHFFNLFSVMLITWLLIVMFIFGQYKLTIPFFFSIISFYSFFIWSINNTVFFMEFYQLYNIQPTYKTPWGMAEIKALTIQPQELEKLKALSYNPAQVRLYSVHLDDNSRFFLLSEKAVAEKILLKPPEPVESTTMVVLKYLGTGVCITGGIVLYLFYIFKN